MTRTASPARIVMVDGHPLTRAGVSAVLAGCSEFVLAAALGPRDDVARELRRQAPDLLLLELMLGGERGWKDALALVGDCRIQHPRMKVLVLTLIEDPAYLRRAREAGAHGYVGKGEPLENLVTAIRDVLAGREYVSPRVAVNFARRFAPPAGTALARAVARLSNRELNVLHAVGLHLPNRLIAADLGITVKTVESHKEALKQKLRVADAVQLARLARDYVATLRS